MALTPAERRFSRFIQEVSTPPSDNKFNEVRGQAIIAVVLAGVAALAGSYGFGYSPRPPEGHNLSAIAFFPAVVAASRFGGRPAAWMTVAILLLVEALYLPRGSLWIADEFVPWYIEIATALCATAILSTGRREPHAPDKGVSQGKRLGIIRNRLPVLFALSENIVK